MKDKTVLKGCTKARGRAEGEALVSEMPLSWAPCSILNNGDIKMVGNPVSGQNVKDKLVVYPTVTGSTSGACGTLLATLDLHVLTTNWIPDHLDVSIIQDGTWGPA